MYSTLLNEILHCMGICAGVVAPVSARDTPHSLWGANVGTLEVCTIDRPYLHQEIVRTVTNVKWCIGVCYLFTVKAFYHEILLKIKMPFLKKRFDLRVIW
jgi:hypothetical protein